jgi:hypothetical protein
MQQKIGRDATNPLSEDEDKNLAAMNSRLQELSNDYIRLNANHAAETDEQKERKQRLLLEYTVLHKKVEDINTAYQSVYAHTAENYMQTKTLSWLTLFLTYKLGAAGMSKPEPFFAGADFVAKEEHAADLEDSKDALYEAALTKLPTYWMLFLFGRANKPEDFARIEEEWEKQVELSRKADEEAEKAKQEFDQRVRDAKRKAIEENVKKARESGNKLTQTLTEEGNLVGVNNTVNFEEREVAEIVPSNGFGKMSVSEATTSEATVSEEPLGDDSLERVD